MMPGQQERLECMGGFKEHKILCADVAAALDEIKSLRLALVEMTDLHAKRRGEVLAAQMVEKAAQDRAEAAEAKLEKSLRLLKYAFECHLPGQEKKRLCGGCLIEIDRFLSPEPLQAPEDCDRCDHSDDHGPQCAEPLRTPKERIATVLEEMAQRTRDDNAWVDRAEAELPEPLRTSSHDVTCACNDCYARTFARGTEPLRTEAECMATHHPAQAKECASCRARAVRTEGAPKQEEANLTPWCECGDMIDARNVGRCGNCLPGLESKAADADVLRAQVGRLEKKLQFIADCGFDEDIDWRAFARAALAPEAPVEKGERT